MSILEHFSCPICMEVIEDSIFECENGHIFCGLCLQRIERCPVCRHSLQSVQRNLALERLRNDTKRPCPNLHCVEEISCAEFTWHVDLCKLKVAEPFAAGDVALARTYLDRGVDPNVETRRANSGPPKPLLKHALIPGHLDVVLLLIERGAAFNLPDLLREAAEYNHVHFIKFFCTSQDLSEPAVLAAFDVAIHRGNVDVVKEFLRLGVDAHRENWCGHTPLICATKEKHTDIVELLLAHGCDMNQRDSSGKTAKDWI